MTTVEMMRAPPTGKVHSSIVTPIAALILIGMIVRVVFLAVDIAWLNLPWSYADTFHEVAIEFANGTKPFEFRIGWLYSYALGSIYRLTGYHESVGRLFSVGAWLGSALALDAMLRLFGARYRARVIALAIFALLPSCVFYTGSLYRDSYQLLFVTLMGLSALHVLIRRAYFWLLPMIIAGAAAGLLHAGLMPATAILAMLTLAAAATRRAISGRELMLLAAVLLAFVAYSAFMFVNFGYVLEGGVVAASDAYQHALDISYEARTQYLGLIPAPADSEIARIGIRLFQYMLEPLPWRVANVGDFAVLIENWLRIAMILMAGLVVLKGPTALRFPLLAMLLSYCFLEGIWSLGTAYWGIAIRHHLPGTALLLACAFAPLRGPALQDVRIGHVTAP